MAEVLAETKTVNEYSFQDGLPFPLEENQELDQKSDSAETEKAELSKPITDISKISEEQEVHQQ